LLLLFGLLVFFFFIFFILGLGHPEVDSQGEENQKGRENKNGEEKSVYPYPEFLPLGLRKCNFRRKLW